MESMVYNEDCMLGMKQYPDKYFDLAVVDPPYGIKRLGVEENRNQNSKFRRSMAKMVDSARKWNNEKPNEEYFKELFRVSKEQIIWGANNFVLPVSEYFMVWDKKQTVDNFASAEYAWVSMNEWKKPAKVFTYQIHAANAAEDKIHPTQKPVKLYSWIYDNYLYCKSCDNAGNYYEDVIGDGGSKMSFSCENCALGEDRNYRVIDTHLGSGSNRIAADKAGNIDFIGYELDKDYYEAQEKRWKNYKLQLKMF